MAVKEQLAQPSRGNGTAAIVKVRGRAPKARWLNPAGATEKEAVFMGKTTAGGQRGSRWENRGKATRRAASRLVDKGLEERLEAGIDNDQPRHGLLRLNRAEHALHFRAFHKAKVHTPLRK